MRASTSTRRDQLETVIEGADLLGFTNAVRQVTLPPQIGQFIVDLTAATRPTVAGCPGFRERICLVGRRSAREPEHRAGGEIGGRAGGPGRR